MYRGTLTFIGSGRCVMPPGWSIRTHSHRYHEMVILCQGALSLTLDDRAMSAKQGDALLYPSGTSHKEWNAHNQTTQTLYLGWLDDCSYPPMVVQDANGRLRLMAQWLLDEIAGAEYPNETLKLAFLGSIVQEYLRLCQAEKPADLVQKARQFMRKNLYSPLTLDAIAEHVFMSKYHFVRTYKRLSGSTPMQDFNVMRAQEARDRIVTTDLPLKTIASNAGFSSPSQLSKVLKKHFGKTPVFYRKENGF